MAKAIYKINGKDFRETLYAIVSGAEGLFDNLQIKDVQIDDNPGQHGSLADLSGVRYEARQITLHIYFYVLSGTARSKRESFIAEFVGPTPKRLERMEGSEVRVWDVILSNGASLNTIKTKLEELTLKLIELAPIKVVYTVAGSTASFTLSPKVSGQTQQPVLISWGDGSFSDNCRNGSVSKVYTDGKTTHHVILSGVMEDVTVTTAHTKLYEVKY